MSDATPRSAIARPQNISPSQFDLGYTGQFSETPFQAAIAHQGAMRGSDRSRLKNVGWRQVVQVGRKATYLRLEYVIQIVIFICFLASFRPNLAPRPAPTGQARKMVQNEHNISPGD